MRFNDFVRKSTAGELSPPTAKPAPKESVKVDDAPELAPIPNKNLSANLATLQQNLNNCLKIIDDEVMKGYLSALDKLPIIAADESRLASLKPIHFFRITSLVYQEDELSVSKLSTLFKVLCNKPCTLVLMIKSDGNTNEFYLGVRSMAAENSTATMMQMLKRSMSGLFPGSRVDDYLQEDLQRDLDKLEIPCLSAVTCVADFRQKIDELTDKRFIQGMEKFVDSMSGRSYQAIFIAENISYVELELIKHHYENICSQISPFVNMQINFSVSSSDSTSKGQSGGMTRSISHGTNRGKTVGKGTSFTDSRSESAGTSYSDSVGKTHSVAEGNSQTSGTAFGKNSSESYTRGTNSSTSKGVHAGPLVVGVNANTTSGESESYTKSFGVSQTQSQSESISKTLSHGLSHTHTVGTNYNVSTGRSVGESFNRSESLGENDSVGESVNFTNSLSLTNTFGSSQGITLNARNMTLQSVTQRLERHLKRIEDCESFGMWNFAAYFIGDSAAEAESAANIYQSVISGKKSGVERSAVNTWLDEEALLKLKPYIKNFVHPKFSYRGFDYEKPRYVEVTPAVMISTNELIIHMGLPYRSVKGLPVVEHAAFAQEVLRYGRREKEIHLGQIYHLGNVTETAVTLDLNSLTMHSFVTGSTGSGKSNAIYHLLSEVRKSGIPFLVVEPAKGEYRKIFPNVNCFGTNPNLGALVQINPFAFPEAVHVLEHIDRLIEIFNVCWPMYAAMPAILKDSIERAYISAGWNLDTSVNKKIHGLFPTFDDVLHELNNLINTSDFSADTKGDYIGALSARLKSLTNGINGRIFSGNEMDLSKLFDDDAILDISRVGSMDTKALIMGLTVLKLQEYRIVNATEMNSPLKHVTVLEEAHNLLKKTSTEQSAESANLQGKSVEMLTNSIAEIRTYGEGFIIADQAPDLLDVAAIRNTNTKIVLRLPEGNDRKIVGNSMALSDKQILEISKLPTGTAAVYQNDWQEAVLCRLPKFIPTAMPLETVASPTASIKDDSDLILHRLLEDSPSSESLAELRQILLRANVRAEARRNLILGLENRDLNFEWSMADFIGKNYDLSNFFHGTSGGNWKNLRELAEIIAANLRDEFSSFNATELKKIMYYCCLLEHERYPDNEIIRQLREDFLKKELE